MEVNRGIELRAMAKLVLSYNFHRASNEAQKPTLDSLLKAPQIGRVSLLADWKELLSLPLQKKATGESFFGSARKELSIFGAVLLEHLPESAPQKKLMLRTHIIIISEILDHTSLRTCQLLELCLSKRRSQLALTGLDVISDCAGHFRSYENLHWAAQQAKDRNCEVALHYGVEKHLKHDCDRMFGWVNLAIQQLLTDGADIREANELQAALMQHFNGNLREDRTAPYVKVLLDDADVPAKSCKFVVPDLKISRTYCVSLEPSPRRAHGVVLRNHVYSTRPVGMQLTISHIEESPGPAEWRRGYYGKGRSAWDTAPQPLAPAEECLGVIWSLALNPVLSQKYSF